jgi:hypothetical protein
MVVHYNEGIDMDNKSVPPHSGHDEAVACILSRRLRCKPPALLTHCNIVFSIRVVLTTLTLCLDWCKPDEFADFIDYAEERNLTNPPGYTIFGQTVNWDIVAKGLAYVVYVMVIVAIRGLLAALEK